MPCFGHGFVAQGLGADTPGNANLAADLKAITKARATNPNFDLAAINLIDQRGRPLRPSQVLKIARILKLDASPGAASTAAAARPAMNSAAATAVPRTH